MRALTIALMLIAVPAMAGKYSTRDMADQLLANRVCGLRFDQKAFTDAIMGVMAETNLPRETVTAQARQLADDIEERLDAENGLTKFSMCAKLRSQRPVFD